MEDEAVVVSLYKSLLVNSFLYLRKKVSLAEN